jgi:hypothetical protein
MPTENGMPIARARGASRSTEVAIRAGVVAPSIASVTRGVRIPAATTIAARNPSGTSSDRGRSGRMIRSVSMLPMPLKTSTENSTTVRPYIGCPRKRLSRCSMATSTSRNPSPMPTK